MWQDAIVEEVRKIRNKHAAQFNYDLNAICKDLKDKEKRSGCKLLSLPSKEPLKSFKTKSRAAR